MVRGHVGASGKRHKLAEVSLSKRIVDLIVPEEERSIVDVEVAGLVLDCAAGNELLKLFNLGAVLEPFSLLEGDEDVPLECDVFWVQVDGAGKVVKVHHWHDSHIFKSQPPECIRQ